MNKFTLDEAIKHCLEIASENEECAKYRPRMDYYDEIPSAEECYQCASEYRQIAKWLTEFKETKRFLKLAVEDIHELLVERKDISIRNTGRGCMVCNYAANCNCCEICTVINELKNWRHADEALKLIGDDTNE